MCSDIMIGTCSWNYSSWIGTVYSKACPSPAGYLAEYSRKYSTVEIDSWFYRIPSRKDVTELLKAVPESFRFTCKINRDLTMPFTGKSRNEKNPKFLDPELFFRFCDAVEPMLCRVDIIIFEFEYLNREKMESVSRFLELFSEFKEKIGKGFPIGIETRNSNYLTDDYFDYLNSSDISHVFSEKQYMPHVYDVYDKYRSKINKRTVIRLLGEDRAGIEKLTGKKWDRIVIDREDKERIVEMSTGINQKVIINVNNHYEGSAPLTIKSLKRLFIQRGIKVK